MSTYSRFEELPIWQEARQLAKDLYTTLKSSEMNRDYRFKSQIMAAIGSVMDNIAEGFEREGNKEFIQFLYIAKGSAGEVRSQVYRALDFKYFSENDSREFISQCEHLSTNIANFIAYLRSSKHRGNKYKRS